jgi:hypothetical protein
MMIGLRVYSSNLTLLLQKITTLLFIKASSEGMDAYVLVLLGLGDSSFSGNCMIPLLVDTQELLLLTTG